MEDERFSHDKEYMLKYFYGFIEDVKDRPGEWENIRSLHGIVMINMERGSLNWRKRHAIARLRNRNAQRKGRNSVKQSGQNSANKQDANLVPCSFYQKGQCQREGSHSGLTHMCSKCWRDKGKVYRHPEAACYAVVGAPPRRKGQF